VDSRSPCPLQTLRAKGRVHAAPGQSPGGPPPLATPSEMGVGRSLRSPQGAVPPEEAGPEARSASRSRRRQAQAAAPRGLWGASATQPRSSSPVRLGVGRSLRSPKGARPPSNTARQGPRSRGPGAKPRRAPAFYGARQRPIKRLGPAWRGPHSAKEWRFLVRRPKPNPQKVGDGEHCTRHWADDLRTHCVPIVGAVTTFP